MAGAAELTGVIQSGAPTLAGFKLREGPLEVGEEIGVQVATQRCGGAFDGAKCGGQRVRFVGRRDSGDCAPVQIFYEWNTARHTSDNASRPEVRPFTRSELQEFSDFADEQVDQARRLNRKGWLRSGTRPCSRSPTPGGCGGGRSRR